MEKMKVHQHRNQRHHSAPFLTLITNPRPSLWKESKKKAMGYWKKTSIRSGGWLEARTWRGHQKDNNTRGKILHHREKYCTIHEVKIPQIWKMYLTLEKAPTRDKKLRNMGATVLFWWTTAEKTYQGKLMKIDEIDENERKVTNIRKKDEKVGFDVKKERGKVHSVHGPLRVETNACEADSTFILHRFFWRFQFWGREMKEG